MDAKPLRDPPTSSRPICPRCRESLTLHNTRIEVTEGNTERVDVYFCIKHGFFRATGSQPLTPGM